MTLVLNCSRYFNAASGNAGNDARHHAMRTQQYKLRQKSKKTKALILLKRRAENKRSNAFGAIRSA
jgi:hypothetical protein